jgi:hypothetical protein
MNNAICKTGRHSFGGTVLRAVALLPPLVGLCLLLTGLPLDPGIETLLPDDPWIARRLAFLAESSAVNMVAVDLSSSSGEGKALPGWADALAARASAIPGVRRVRSRFPLDPWLAAGGALFQALPELLDESDYPDLTERMEEVALSRRLAACRLDLLRPGGEFRQRWVATDPLGISELMVQRVRRLAGAAGFHGRLRGDRLWSEDGQHLLVLVEADTPVTNARAGSCWRRCGRRWQRRPPIPGMLRRSSPVMSMPLTTNGFSGVTLP